MILLPAIDLYGGKVIRLAKGDFEKKTTYGGDPLAVAESFRSAGCEHIHIVDLEGAEKGEPMHFGVLQRIAGLGMKVQYGGGLRSRDAVAAALDAGAWRVMVGSLLFRGEDAAAELFSYFDHAQEKIVPSLDVRDGVVVVSGWKERTGSGPYACMEHLGRLGYRTFLVTAVEQDGMLAGPDMSLYRELAPLHTEVVAAGGVTTVEDVARLSAAGLAGAVVGKALYESGFDLRAGLAAARGGMA